MRQLGLQPPRSNACCPIWAHLVPWAASVICIPFEELKKTKQAQIAMLGPRRAITALSAFLSSSESDACTAGRLEARQAGQHQRMPAPGECLLAAHHTGHGMQTGRAFAARCASRADESRCC